MLQLHSAQFTDFQSLFETSGRLFYTQELVLGTINLRGKKIIKKTDDKTKHRPYHRHQDLQNLAGRHS